MKVMAHDDSPKTGVKTLNAYGWKSAGTHSYFNR